jgi:hypothetical protein
VNVTMFRTVSLIVLPMSTAGWEIGIDRRRSMKPFCMSSASPIAVNADPNTTV